MSGYFTPGLPVVTMPFTGNERIPVDTVLSQGINPESEAITLSLLSAIGYSAIQSGTVSGATATCNCALGSHFTVTLTTTGHTLTLSNPSPGQEVEIEVVQGGSGSCTITTYTAGTWPTNGATPTLTTTLATIDIIKATYSDTAAKWRYATKGLNYA